MNNLIFYTGLILIIGGITFIAYNNWNILIDYLNYKKDPVEPVTPIEPESIINFNSPVSPTEWAVSTLNSPSSECSNYFESPKISPSSSTSGSGTDTLRNFKK